MHLLAIIKSNTSKGHNTNLKCARQVCFYHAEKVDFGYLPEPTFA